MYRYLLYFLRLISPLSFKSVAAQLNISKDNNPVSIDSNFSDGSDQRGTCVVVEGFLVSIWSHGINTGGKVSSSGGFCDSWEIATGVITFSVFSEDVSSDNMGNKEFSVGVFLFEEGTNLINFPTMEDIREVFLLYHMNMIPMATTHTPTNINKAKMSLGDNETWVILINILKNFIKYFHRHGR